MLLRCFLLFAVVAYGHAQQSSTAAAARPALYLLAIGPEAAADVDGLAEYLQRALDLKPQRLPALPADARSWDAARNQLKADGLWRQVHEQVPQVSGRQDAIIIAVTAYDIYIPGIDWTFAFGYRAPRFGLVSTARLSLPTDVYPTVTDEVRTWRLRKVVLKHLGVLYYQLAFSADPKSIMYRDILGVDDLDRLEERY
jgi:predicted Zn-dependent protease